MPNRFWAACGCGNQLSILKAIREEMRLQASQKFAIIPKGNTIVLAPIRRLDQVRGIFKGADPSDYLTDESYRRLQRALMENPEMGDVMSGTGGFRKVRWEDARRAKASGAD